MAILVYIPTTNGHFTDFSHQPRLLLQLILFIFREAILILSQPGTEEKPFSHQGTQQSSSRSIEAVSSYWGTRQSSSHLDICQRYSQSIEPVSSHRGTWQLFLSRELISSPVSFHFIWTQGSTSILWDSGYAGCIVHLLLCLPTHSLPHPHPTTAICTLFWAEWDSARAVHLPESVQGTVWGPL